MQHMQFAVRDATRAVMNAVSQCQQSFPSAWSSILFYAGAGSY